MRFCHVLVEDEATRRLAVSEGVVRLPAIHVYSDAGAGRCVVSCAPRASGPTLSLERLRDAVDACADECAVDDECAESTDAAASDPAADVVFAMLPISIVYVLFEKVAAVSADLFLPMSQSPALVE